MKNKASKFLAVFLALIMVLSILPMSSITASAETASGTCGENLTWTFDDETGVLTISGSGDMEDYVVGSIPWKNYKSEVLEVVFDGEITYIGNYCFYFLSNLTSITIPDSVTKIGDRAFCECNNLENIVIPDSVTKMGEYVFYNCAKAKSITIGKGLTEISSHAFSRCSGLKDIEIPDNISVIGDSAFWFCTGLESVKFPETLIKISEAAFEHCQSLKTVSIPASVESIGAYAFASCTSLTEISVDKDNEYFCNDEYGVLFNKDKTLLKQYPAGRTDIMYSVLYPVQVIGRGAFAEAEFTTVTLPSSLEIINEWAFDSCYNMRSIYVRTKLYKIGRYAFYDCYRLSDVYYTGYQYQFDNIEIDSDNTNLTKANIHLSYTCEAEHTLTDWIIYDGFCESEERELRFCIYCADGNGQRYTGNIIQHEMTDWEIYKEPTCTNQGEEFRYCERCGENEETRYLNALGHSYTSVVTAPTCIEQGYTTNTCAVCGDVVVDNYVDALGHTPAEAVEENYVASTCKVTGSKDVVVYCSVCDEEISRETVTIETLEHTLSEYEKEIIAPTCTENGSKEVVSCCVECDTVINKEVVTVDALGHTSSDAVEENYVASTCTETGSVDKVVYCSVCDKELNRETENLELIEHNDGDNDGYCDVCNELLDPSVECEHNCHKGGFSGFIWKIINFFNQLFGLNKTCECGVAHY